MKHKFINTFLEPVDSCNICGCALGFVTGAHPAAGSCEEWHEWVGGKIREAGGSTAERATTLPN